MSQFELKLLEQRLKTLQQLQSTQVPNTSEWRKYKEKADDCRREIERLSA